MIVLDTNVVSEAMKPEPHPARALMVETIKPPKTLYLSSVTLAELLFGIAALPAGQRKDMLAQALDGGLLELFRDRVFALRHRGGATLCRVGRHGKLGGRGFPTPDGYIAAIAASRDLIVASRDTAPYEAADVSVINPWEV